MKLKHREVGIVAQGHTASYWWSWYSGPSTVQPQPIFPVRAASVHHSRASVLCLPHSPCFPAQEVINVYHRPAASQLPPSSPAQIAPPAHVPYSLPLSQPGSSPSGHLLLPTPSSLNHPHGLDHPHLPGPRPVSCGNDFSWQRILEPFPPQ